MIALPKPQKYQVTVLSKEKVSTKVYLVRFALVAPTEMTFLAGQTVMFHVGEGVNRSMSIASTSDEKNSLLVVHDVGPMGPFSQWTIDAKVGDAITFIGPLGIFVLDRESPRKKVLVATGSGIAPFRGMLLDYLEHGGTDDVTLYWGLRHEEDMFWEHELTQVSLKYPNFRFVLTLSRPADTWQGKLGHVEAHIFADEVNLPGSDFYLCGNKEMIHEMQETLAARGVPKAQIKSELFY